MLNEKVNEILKLDNFKYIFSSPNDKNDAKKVIFRKIIEKESFWQEEKFVKNQVFHQNINENEIFNHLINSFDRFNQCCAQNKDGNINIFNFGGKIVVKKDKNISNYNMTHNKIKKYIINEGDNIPALIELGVFTKDLKIVSSKYDKFKQINKFIEIIDDFISKYDRKSIKIIDFGSGKSYLTFVLYYYLTEIMKIEAYISGYDLKTDVVQHCNELATKYNYKNLKFYNEDIANVKSISDVDMLITLHACDTATDLALNFAINNNIKYIFSVPCCQHEINKSITKGGDFDIMLDYGIIKERFSALLTDTIRAKLLECNGYSVDLLEFVDFSHTPKNIMIRAKKVANTKNSTKSLDELQSKYKFNQTLLDMF